MKKYWKYIRPPLFGLLIYVTVRVLNDTISKFRFWERDWRINTIEIVSTIGVSYLLLLVFRLLFRRFDKQLQHSFSWKIVGKELLWVFVFIELIVNVTITPMAALTDDGLSWGDVAAINIVPLLYCIIYYGLVRSQRLFKAYIQSKLQLEKITNDHLQTELKFLKAQFHPHFLFNALNTIYFQVDENTGAAKKSIEKFSELLRYQLYDQQQTVPVSREIHYLKNFIELQQTRTSDKLQLQVHFDASLNGQQVYPLLFLPLVENAFKYVGGDFHICIEAKDTGGQILFTVVNSIPKEPMPVKEGGIGLDNLKRRLELLYPQKHEFSTQIKGHSFLAGLKLEA